MAIALNQRFDTEEQFLEHAAKLATLKPGDVVYIDGWRKAIYWKTDHGSDRPLVLYFDKD